MSGSASGGRTHLWSPLAFADLRWCRALTRPSSRAPFESGAVRRVGAPACGCSGGFGGAVEEEADDHRADVFGSVAVVAAAAQAGSDEREQRFEQAVQRNV